MPILNVLINRHSHLQEQSFLMTNSSFQMSIFTCLMIGNASLIWYIPASSYFIKWCQLFALSHSATVKIIKHIHWHCVLTRRNTTSSKTDAWRDKIKPNEMNSSEEPMRFHSGQGFPAWCHVVSCCFLLLTRLVRTTTTKMTWRTFLLVILLHRVWLGHM